MDVPPIMGCLFKCVTVRKADKGDKNEAKTKEALACSWNLRGRDNYRLAPPLTGSSIGAEKNKERTSKKKIEDNDKKIFRLTDRVRLWGG